MASLYVRPISSKRKSCSHCKAKLGHGTEWAAFQYKNQRVRGAYTADYNRQVRFPVIDHFCKNCWDGQCRGILDNRLRIPPELHTNHCRQPYWLYVPGTSPLTKQEFDWCDQISSFLRQDVLFHHGEYKFGIEYRQTGSINMLRTYWERHPLKDWLQEQGLTWGEIQQYDSSCQDINVYFEFVDIKVEDRQRLSDEMNRQMAVGL